MEGAPWPVYMVAAFVCIFIPIAWFVCVIWLVILRLRKNRNKGKDGACPACGYDLTGNTSGTCPECGHVIAAGEADSTSKLD